MIGFRQFLAAVAGLAAVASLAYPITTGTEDGAVVSLLGDAGLAVFAGMVVCMAAVLIRGSLSATIEIALLALVAHVGAFLLIGGLAVASGQTFGGGFWCLLVSAWLLAWCLVDRLSAIEPGSAIRRRGLALVVPLVFGLWLVILWEVLVRGLHVPSVLLPPPSAIAVRFAASIPTLWADFQQTFMKAVLIGYLLGCASGFVVAILIDRSPFLQRGLMPIGNLASALPIVGVAPIMVMWFGFDWPSKAAVVVIMTFFPMLVNTIAGLAVASAMQKDLMKTYGASYWQTLAKLRLPEAMPLIFNALKINSTLALIGAIVAEFFGTPIVGMGFRISTEVGRMNIDMVWAEITVAALAGTAFYGSVVLLERLITFWHPSIRA